MNQRQKETPISPRGSIGISVGLLCAAVLAVGATTVHAQPCQPEWVGTFSGHPLDSIVTSFATWDDGGGAALYVGGLFQQGGSQTLKRIGKWDGNNWSPLGVGLDSTVWCMNVFDDGLGGGPALYVGGQFVRTDDGNLLLNRIAKWDGSTWSALGTGMNNLVNALAVFDDGNGPALYAAGNFTTAGGVTVNRVAKWNPQSQTWSALGSGTVGVNSTARCLGVYDDGNGDALYIGGDFDQAGGAPASRVAKWNGSTWSALGNGLRDEPVRAMAVFNDGGGDALFVGGQFTLTGDFLAVNRIAKWDGSNWSALRDINTNEPGVSDWVRGLNVFDDGTGAGPALYVGGDFFEAGANPASKIARWNGSEWSGLESGMDAQVYALQPLDNSLFVGGTFGQSTGGDSRIARYQGCVPSSCLSLDVDNLVAGQVATWTISGAFPGEQVVVVYGFDAGSSIFSGLRGYCASFGIAGINRPARVVGVALADGGGVAAITREVPGNAGGVALKFQAAMRGTCPEECLSDILDAVVGN